MAKNVTIRDVDYAAVPAIDVPLTDGTGDAHFVDPSDATISSSTQLRNGVKAINAEGALVTGTMSEKAAATYTPGTSDQEIAAGQYLNGKQTIKGDSNLVSANIVDGKSIFGVAGSAKIPVITQDSTTKVLSIS